MHNLRRHPARLLAFVTAACLACLQATAGAEHGVWLREDDQDDAVRLVLVNDYHAPVQVAWHVSELENAVSDGPFAGVITLAARSEQALVTLSARRPAAWSFAHHHHYLHGDPNARHAEATRYRPPFGAGERYLVSQAWPDVFTHADAPSRHALDLDMPEGTPVHAARSGVVFVAVDSFHAGGPDAWLAESANHLRVLHDDGTMALYAHLAAGSLLVQPGQRVTRGQRVAASGNTGFSTGPHLHFAVQRNSARGVESLPVLFEDPQDVAAGRAPRRGEYLAAPPWP